MFKPNPALSLLMVMLLFRILAHAQAGQTVEPESPGTQGATSSSANAARLVKFGGTLRDGAGAPLVGTMGVTVSIYKEQQGGTPLWMETQNVQLDAQGNYSVLLGATESEGLPLELFSSGESRWLGIEAQVPGEVEQPRVLLVSVPYALRAADAETLGGKPLSAFVLAAPDATGTQAASTIDSGKKIVSHVAAAVSGAAVTGVTTNGGTQNKLPKWDATGTNLIDSAVFENGGLVGIGTTNPRNVLDVHGAITLSGDPTFFNNLYYSGGWKYVGNGYGTVLGFNGSNLGSIDFETAPSNAGGADAAASPITRLIVTNTGNVGIGTASPKNLLDVHGAMTLSGDPTLFNNLYYNGGFKYVGNGYGTVMGFNGYGVGSIDFETAPNNVNGADAAAALTTRLIVTNIGNVGIGTATPGYKLDVQGGQINASDGLCIGGTCQNNWNSFSGSATFSAAPSGSGVSQGSLYVNPASASAGQTLIGAAVNGTQEFKVDSGGSITTAGDINLPNTNGAGTTGVITLGGNRFLHNFGTNNTFVGQSAGNFTMTGIFNTASGLSALFSNTTGHQNTANGAGALFSNTTGNSNTAVGWNALSANTITADNTFTTGNANTAIGFNALQGSTTGNGNTASGNNSLGSNTTGVGNTALGGQAGVTTTTTNANTTGSNNTFIGRLSGPGVPSASSLQNATAIGANAVVSASNALVLGSINGVNGATSSVNVGIGTATPTTRLDVESTNSDVGTFITAGTNGNVALQGVATGASGQNAGVLGGINTTTDNTAAVIGLANGTSGFSAGVYGQSSSPTGAGGAFSNTNVGGISLAAMDQNQSSNFLFTVRTSGNVGIGTTTPKTKWEVAGGDAYLSTVATGLILKSPDGTHCARISLDNTGALVTTALTCP